MSARNSRSCRPGRADGGAVVRGCQSGDAVEQALVDVVLPGAPAVQALRDQTQHVIHYLRSGGPGRPADKKLSHAVAGRS